MRTNSFSEADLVRRAPRDMDAFGELVERYRKSIQRQCFSRVRDVSAGLARIGGTEAAAVLGEHLLATASRDAAGALGALGEPGLRILRDALRHAQPRVRAEAARAVWESGGDQAAMPLLEELAASDPSSSVRFQAKLAVRKMRRR